MAANMRASHKVARAAAVHSSSLAEHKPRALTPGHSEGHDRPNYDEPDIVVVHLGSRA